MLKNEKGITLLEVLAATVILSLVVMMFLNLSSFSLTSNRNDDLRNGALQLAERVLNEQRAQLASSVPVLQNWSNVQAAETSSPYSYYIQQSDIQSQTFTTAPFANRKHVSLQSIVLFRDNAAAPARLVQRVLTVTVYWGEPI